MPPPVVGLARPAASPTATTRSRVGALDRRERQHLQARAGRVARSAPWRSRETRARYAWNRIAARVGRHQPHARHLRHSPRVNGTIHANPRGARLLSEIDLDVVQARERHLELRALQIGARDAEAELAVEAVLRAAGQHADAAAIVAVAVADRDAAVTPPLTAIAATRAPRADRRAGARPRARRAPDRTGRDRRRPRRRRRRRCGR